jgi:hypothetical protein
MGRSVGGPDMIDSFPVPGQVLRWFCSQHGLNLEPESPLQLECPAPGCPSAADFGRPDCQVFLTGGASVCGCGCGNP